MTDRPPVLVTRRLADEVMRFLDEHCTVTLNDEDRPMPRERLLAEVKGKRGLLPMLTDRIDEELLDAAGPDLAVVANFAVGYDNVDLGACAERGVVVTNATRWRPWPWPRARPGEFSLRTRPMC